MANNKKTVRITNQMWCDIMNRIHTGRSCCTEEAEKLGLSLPELLEMGDAVHIRGDNGRWKEWCQAKRESSKRDKRISRSRKTKMAVPASTPESKSEPAPASTPESDPGSEIDQLEFLLLHRKNSRKKPK